MTTVFSSKNAANSGNQSFQLTYQTLEGYANLLGRKIEVKRSKNNFCVPVARGNRLRCVLLLNPPPPPPPPPTLVLSLSLSRTHIHALSFQNHVTLADYHLHSCMYSISSKQFIGRFCDSMRCSLVESLQTGGVMCPIQEV